MSSPFLNKFASALFGLFDKKKILIIIAFIILGVFIRVIIASHILLNSDELYYLFLVKDYSFIQIALNQQWDTAHPPLYFLFLKFWQSISDHYFFIRIPSLIASVFILFLVPVVARKLSPSLEFHPILTLFFFALSKIQSRLQSIARMYSFEILLMLVSILLFLKIINNQSKIKKYYLILFPLVNLIMFLTDYSGAWLILSYWVFYTVNYLILKEKHNQKVIFHSLLSTTLLVSLWLPFFIPGLSKALSMSPNLEQSMRFLPFIKFTVSQLGFFTDTDGGDLIVKWGLLTEQWWAICILFLSLLGIIVALKKNKNTGLFLLICSLSPFFICVNVSRFVVNIYTARNLIISHIALIFGLSYLFSYLLQKKSLVLSLILFIFLFLWIKSYFQIFPSHNWLGDVYNWKSLVHILRNFDNNKPKYILTSNQIHELRPLFYYDKHEKFGSIGKIKIVNINDFHKYQFISPEHINIFFIQLYSAEYPKEAVNYLENFFHCRFNKNKIEEQFYLAYCAKIIY